LLNILQSLLKNEFLNLHYLQVNNSVKYIYNSYINGVGNNYIK